MRENVFALRPQGLSGGYWTSGRRMAIGRFRRSKPAYGWISRLAPKSVHETFTNRGNFFRGGGPDQPPMQGILARLDGRTARIGRSGARIRKGGCRHPHPIARRGICGGCCECGRRDDGRATALRRLSSCCRRRSKGRRRGTLPLVMGLRFGRGDVCGLAKRL